MDSRMESLLLSFDEQYPCWTPSMLELAELDRGTADTLVHGGMLKVEKGVYWLSKSGKAKFSELAAESYLPSRPGETSNPRQTALRGELMLLLDKRHLQRWGVKEYAAPFRFPTFRGRTFSSWTGRLRSGATPMRPFSGRWPRIFRRRGPPRGFGPCRVRRRFVNG